MIATRLSRSPRAIYYREGKSSDWRPRDLPVSISHCERSRGRIERCTILDSGVAKNIRAPLQSQALDPLKSCPLPEMRMSISKEEIIPEFGQDNENLEAMIVNGVTTSHSDVLPTSCVEPVDNIRSLLEPNGNVLPSSASFIRPLPRTSSSHSHLDKYLKKFGKSVGGLRSPMKRQWSAGESNLSREFSKTSDLDVRPRLPPRPKSEFFNVGDPNKYAKNSTSSYERQQQVLQGCDPDSVGETHSEENISSGSTFTQERLIGLGDIKNQYPQGAFCPDPVSIFGVGEDKDCVRDGGFHNGTETGEMALDDCLEELPDIKTVIIEGER
ncbi:cyclin-dependent kinase 14 [Trichonephila clavipes]|nr:cyclin-dependent kinase 14 [Trichonephila clavipes]